MFKLSKFVYIMIITITVNIFKKLYKIEFVCFTFSGEGTLTAFDIRKHKLMMQSELFDSEMLSMAVMKAIY